MTGVASCFLQRTRTLASAPGGSFSPDHGGNQAVLNRCVHGGVGRGMRCRHHHLRQLYVVCLYSCRCPTLCSLHAAMYPLQARADSTNRPCLVSPYGPVGTHALAPAHVCCPTQMQSDGPSQWAGGGINVSGEAPFEIRGFSLANAAALVGLAITCASFFEYFSTGGAGGLSGIGFVYGIPIALIGLALKVRCTVLCSLRGR